MKRILIIAIAGLVFSHCDNNYAYGQKAPPGTEFKKAYPQISEQTTLLVSDQLVPAETDAIQDQAISNDVLVKEMNSTGMLPLIASVQKKPPSRFARDYAISRIIYKSPTMVTQRSLLKVKQTSTYATIGYSMASMRV